MNKAELVEALAVHFDGNKAEATRALNAVVETIIHETAREGKVSITGFGVFEKIHRPARTVRNPRTGERKDAPATDIPRFRPGTDLKAYVAGEKQVPGAAGKPAARKPASKKPEAKKSAAATPAETSTDKTAKKSTGKAPRKASAKKAAKRS
ncbi:hypothetical protein GCM10027418_29330 [Mariniluteicoccus endophyticus]